MALGPFTVVVVLALTAFAWSPIAALVIVALALLGHGLYELVGAGGERFFTGSDSGVAPRHRHP